VIARVAWSVLVVVALLPAVARGHKPSDSYLSVAPHGASLAIRWDIALRDLDQAIGLDADGDGRITWGELRARAPAVDAYAQEHLHLATDGGACPTHVATHEVDRHTDGAYTVLRLVASCPSPPSPLRIDYALFFERDPQHRGLLQVARAGASATAIFSADRRTQQIDLAAPAPPPWSTVATYGREGVWHIWLGWDHMLFVLSLLLPAVLWRDGRRWRPAPRFGPALADVLRIVTAFTASHAITLSLAVAGVVRLPSRWVESAIAASVALAALNNLWPVVRGRRWTVAFGFGLVHGLGFAGVLANLGLPRGALVPALVGFNAGVETGQLAIVAAFLPFAWCARESGVYRRAALVLGSLAIACCAAVWLMERSLDVRLPFAF
jgi:HupE / UreJ protein